MFDFFMLSDNSFNTTEGFFQTFMEGQSLHFKHSIIYQARIKGMKTSMNKVVNKEPVGDFIVLSER